MRPRALQASLRTTLLVAAVSVFAEPGGAQAVRAQVPAKADAGSLASALVVTGAWMRPALAGGNGAAYMTVSNRGQVPVRIVGASTRSAAAAELHTTTVHDGLAHMEMTAAFDIASGARALLEPGGMHYMLVRLRHALVPGDTVMLTLVVQSVASPARGKGAVTPPKDKGSPATHTLLIAVPVRGP